MKKSFKLHPNYYDDGESIPELLTRLVENDETTNMLKENQPKSSKFVHLSAPMKDQLEARNPKTLKKKLLPNVIFFVKVAGKTVILSFLRCWILQTYINRQTHLQSGKRNVAHLKSTVEKRYDFFFRKHQDVSIELDFTTYVPPQKCYHSP